MHHIKNNWLIPIFFSPGNSYTKELLVLLHLGIEGISEIDTDLKGRFVSLIVTPSNEVVVFVPLQGITPGKSWP